MEKRKRIKKEPAEKKKEEVKPVKKPKIKREVKSALIERKGDKKKVLDALEEIIQAVKNDKEFSKQEETILEVSKEPNKEELLNNFIYKVQIFYDYSVDSLDEDQVKFPLDSWVDSFFEKS